MTRPLLTLCLMVKNEAQNIRATLESAKPFIDRWMCVDTGSTDGTPDIVREMLAGVPGRLVEESFVDYATTRNRVLDLADTFDASVFSLFLSGDETLRGGAELHAFLEQHRDAEDGAYCVTMQAGARTWPYTRVLRTDSGWRYHGEIHERPVGPKGEVHAPIIPGATVTHKPSDPERKMKRLREYDLPKLTERVEDESKSLEDRAHAIFFLAETHANLAGMSDRAPGGPYLSHVYSAMALYFRFAQIAEQPDRPTYEPAKVAYALFLYYHLSEPGQAGFYQSDELVARLSGLVQVFKSSPELRWLLAKHASIIDPRQGLFHALEAAKLAIAAKANPTYEASDVRMEWLSYAVAADCAQRLKRTDQARELAKKCVEAGGPRAPFESLL